VLKGMVCRGLGRDVDEKDFEELQMWIEPSGKLLPVASRSDSHGHQARALQIDQCYD
jgi:hypothetical protein